MLCLAKRTDELYFLPSIFEDHFIMTAMVMGVQKMFPGGSKKKSNYYLIISVYFFSKLYFFVIIQRGGRQLFLSSSLDVHGHGFLSVKVICEFVNNIIH